VIHGIQHALWGLQQNQARFARAAERISRWGTSASQPGAEPVDLAGEVVNLMIARLGYRANLEVVRTEDELLGTLLDEMA
jgi:hypothetical protein